MYVYIFEYKPPAIFNTVVQTCLPTTVLLVYVLGALLHTTYTIESYVFNSNLFVCVTEALEKSVKEKEMYSAKLKTLTVKARKELDSTKQQLQKVQEEKTKLQTQLTSLDSQLQVCARVTRY